MQPKPKKSLGQNFLVDPNIRQKIVSACGLAASDQVLEIGPGKGEMTELLAAQSENVVAVELDRELYARLKTRFSAARNVRIVNGDILDFDPVKSFGHKNRIKVVGNIPYYITTPIIEWVMKARGVVDEVFLTVQKEFAERAAARPGSKIYGRLSCFVQYYSEPEILFRIKRGSFFPAPEVDSAFLRLKIRKSPLLKEKEEEAFFRILRLAFGQRRKTLRNTLKGAVEGSALTGISHLRPEQLSLRDFLALAKDSVR